MSFANSEHGVVSIEPISKGVCHVHIASTYPLLGSLLVEAIEQIISHFKKTGLYHTILTIIPKSSLAKKLANKLNFKLRIPEISLYMRKL